MDSRSFVEALGDIRALRSSVISVLPDLLKRLELIDSKLEIGLEQVSQPGTVDGSTQTELTDIPTQQNAIHIDSLLNDIPSISSNSIHFTHNNFVETFSNEQLSSRPKKKRKIPLNEEEHFSRRPQQQRKEAAAAITASCEIVPESQQKMAWNDHVKTEPVACYSVEDDDDEVELHQQQHTSFQHTAEHQQPGSSSVNGELQLNIGDGFSEIIDFNTALVELPPDAPGYFMEHQQHGDEFAVENYGNSPGIGSLIHRTLTEERTAFTCLLCSRDFNQRANCVRHIHTVHANARPYQCDECDKSYKHMHHLSRHKLASHGEAMGQCPVEEPKIHGEGEVMGSSEV